MKTFEQTCNKLYNRHRYTITVPSGGVFTFDDYEVMRAYWFQQFSTIKGSIVDVIDLPPTPVGFRD